MSDPIPNDYNPYMDRVTGGFHPTLPKAHEKSVVLGGGKVLYPVENPQEVADVLAAVIKDVALRAYRTGREDAKRQMREAMF